MDTGASDTMEWVETTGNTLEAAKEAALDELGVDEQEAEFEILQESKTGLFGRVRAEARIRARIRPTAPRAKEDRRDRRRSRNREETATTDAGAPSPATIEPGPSERRAGGEEQSAARPRRRRTSAAGAAAATATEAAVQDDGDQETQGNRASAPSRSRSGTRSPNGGRGLSDEPGEAPLDEPVVSGASRAPRSPQARSDDRAGEPTVDVALEEQGRVAQQFLQGLVEQFGLQADISFAQPDEDTVDLAISGQDLGLLIGPRGATLLAIQDLTRTVVQRKTGASNGRIHVDVGGYQEKRAAALANFARQVAAQVVESGTRRALEPMPPADRKVVHDALTDVAGVSTLSEGEDPHRRVVIVPAS
jgi:spoIIIJ-associated protein